MRMLRLGGEQVKEMLREQFPELAPHSLELLGEGWDNTAWLVNGTYVFRFPRRQLGADCLQAEIAVLPRIAQRLPRPISVPTMIGEPAGGYPWRFAGSPLLPGQPAAEARLTNEDRLRLAEPLAEFLRELHAISYEAAIGLGARPDPLGRFDFPKRIAKILHKLETAARKQFLTDPKPYLAILEKARQLSVGEASALVHGDLYSLHLLVDDRRRLAGIIDWGDVHAGHVAVDLMLAFSFLPPAARRRFFEVYGETQEADLHLARFRALDHTLSLIHYADEIGNEPLLNESLQSLQFLATPCRLL